MEWNQFFATSPNRAMMHHATLLNPAPEGIRPC